MAADPRYKTHDETLTNAQSKPKEINLGGNGITMIDGDDGAGAADANALVTVRLGRQSADPIKFRPGRSIMGIAFDSFWIEWAAQTDVQVQFIVTQDDPCNRVDVIAG